MKTTKTIITTVRIKTATEALLFILMMFELKTRCFSTAIIIGVIGVLSLLTENCWKDVKIKKTDEQRIIVLKLLNHFSRVKRRLKKYKLKNSSFNKACILFSSCESRKSLQTMERDKEGTIIINGCKDGCKQIGDK